MKKSKRVMWRLVERERESEAERGTTLPPTSFGRVEVDDLTNQREHILLSEEQSHNDGKTWREISRETTCM